MYLWHNFLYGLCHQFWLILAVNSTIAMVLLYALIIFKHIKMTNLATSKFNKRCENMRWLTVYLLLDIVRLHAWWSHRSSQKWGSKFLLSTLRQDPYALETAYLSIISFDLPRKTIGAINWACRISIWIMDQAPRISMHYQCWLKK